MLSFNFDFWTLLVGSLVFFFTTCSSNATVEAVTNGETHPTTLTTPKNEGHNYTDVKTKLTLVLLKNGSVYAYEGLEAEKGFTYAKGRIRGLMLAAKRKFPAKEFVVVIKPTDQSSYTNTVSVLDEMAVNNIDRYSIEQLSEREKQILNVKDHIGN